MPLAELGIEEKPTHTWYMRWCMWKQRRRISPPHPPLVKLPLRPTVLGPWFLEERTNPLNLDPTPGPKPSSLAREKGIRNPFPHLDPPPPQWA